MNKEELYREYYTKVAKAKHKLRNNFVARDMSRKYNVKENTIYKYIKEVQIKRSGIYEVIGRLENGESLGAVKESYKIK